MKKFTSLILTLILTLTLPLTAFASSQDNTKKAQMFYDFLMNYFAANLEPDTPLWYNDTFLIQLICFDEPGYFEQYVAPHIEITGEKTLLLNRIGISSAFDFLFWPEEIWILQEAVNENILPANFTFEVTTDGKILSADGKSYREILILLGHEVPDEPDEPDNPDNPNFSTSTDINEAEAIIQRLDMIVGMMIIAFSLGVAIFFLYIIYCALRKFL